MNFLHKCSVFAHVDKLENAALLPITFPIDLDSRISTFITVRLTDPSIGENPNVTGVSIDLVSEIAAGRKQSLYLAKLSEGFVAPKTHLAKSPDEFVPASLSNSYFSMMGHYPVVVVEFLSQVHELSKKLIHDFIIYLNWRYSFNMISGCLEGAFSHISFVNPVNYYPYPTNIGYAIYPAKSKLDISRFTIREFDYFREKIFRKKLHFSLLADCINNEMIDSESALISAVTALEVGVKEYFFEKNPYLYDLYSGYQFPPVDKVMSQVFTKMYPQLNEEKYEFESTLKEIKIITNKRNNLMHTGVFNSSRQEVRYFLEVIKNILMIIEYLSGSDWAEQLIVNLSYIRKIYQR